MKSTRKIYLVAGALSLILYISGIITGQYIAQRSEGGLEKNISYVATQIEGVQEEYILLSFRGKESCSILATLSSDIASRLDSISKELVRLESLGQKGEGFEKLKGDYASLAIRAWVLNSNIKETCDADVVSALYFYSYPCAECQAQESVMEEMKEIYGRKKVIAYAIDYNVNRTSANVLIKSYGINRTPSLLFGNRVYDGLVGSGNLSSIICRQLRNVTCA